MNSSRTFRWMVRPVVAGAVLLLAASTASWADPPPWAPSYIHGAGHTFTANSQTFDEAAYLQSSRDYGITYNTCNRDAVSSLITGQAGDGQASAAKAGSIVGTLVGDGIGANMDSIDQACAGQALERAEDYQAVSWTNPNTGARYNVAMTGVYQWETRFCRGFVTRVILGEVIETIETQACRDPDGTWRRAG